MIKKLFLLSVFSICACSAIQGHSEGDSVKIWGAKVSPFVRKVITVAEQKHLSYEVQEVLPKSLAEVLGQDSSTEFLATSPLGKIPSMQYRDFSIADSAVIVSFFEKNWPEESVYPENAREYARSIWFEKYADTRMTEIIHKLFFEVFVKPNVLKQKADTALVEKMLEEMPTILTYLEGELIKNGSTFLVNENLTIGDIAVAHHFVSLKLAGIEWDKDKYPHLAGYINKVFVQPSFAKSIQGLL